MILGDVHGALGRLGGAGEGFAADLLLGIGGDGVFGLLQSGQDAGLVLEEGLLLQGGLDLDVAADGPGVENVPGDVGAEAPGAAVAAQQPAAREGLQADGPAEAELGVEVRRGGADAGRGGGQTALAAAHVRTAAQAFGRHPYGHGGRGDRDGGGGCQRCVQVCPTGAITGPRAEAHNLDMAKCIKCRSCYEICRFDAVAGDAIIIEPGA